jgi:hypothetical protein
LSAYAIQPYAAHSATSASATTAAACTGNAATATTAAACTGNAATVTNGIYTTGAQNVTAVKTFQVGIAISSSTTATKTITDIGIVDALPHTGLIWTRCVLSSDFSTYISSEAPVADNSWVKQ